MSGHVTVSCPEGCAVPIAVPYTIEISPPGRGFVQTRLAVDWDTFRGDLERHVLADPEAHPNCVTAIDEESTPNTSEEYFLDLLTRIDREVEK